MKLLSESLHTFLSQRYFICLMLYKTETGILSKVKLGWRMEAVVQVV